MHATMSRVWPRAVAVLALASFGCVALAQPGPPGRPPAPPKSPRESAQVDLTGYWVALVTEDWAWRMITAPKGDATSVPLNPAGRRVAAEWDPARDAASGEACRPFGAAALMRMPLRLHVTWQNDETLKIETDAGQQTRLFHFAPTAAANAAPQAPANAERSWQGVSTAEWTRPIGGFNPLAAIAAGAAVPTQSGAPPKGALKVVTTNLRAGYLRKNGVPYSENALLTEYFSRLSADGNDYLTVLTVVHDPAYLMGDFITSSQFKREPDAAKWNPTPCGTAPPRATAGARQ
jgi:hypothetical protein